MIHIVSEDIAAMVFFQNDDQTELTTHSLSLPKHNLLFNSGKMKNSNSIGLSATVLNLLITHKCTLWILLRSKEHYHD